MAEARPIGTAAQFHLLARAAAMRPAAGTRSECDGVGFGTMPFAGQKRIFTKSVRAREFGR